MKSKLSYGVFCSEAACLKVSQKLSFSPIKKCVNAVNQQALEVRQIQSAPAPEIKDLTPLGIRITLESLALATLNKYLMLGNLQHSHG